MDAFVFAVAVGVAVRGRGMVDGGVCNTLALAFSERSMAIHPLRPTPLDPAPTTLIFAELQAEPLDLVGTPMFS